MMLIPFVNPGLQYKNLREEVLRRFDRISLTGNYILGEELREFEKNFAEFCGTSYALGVGNGSDAISFSLLGLGVKPGDEVITAPNSFVASAWTIANIGAKPVFVDVNDDFNINPRLIQEAITPKTKAILPVHLTGRVADMEMINKIAKDNNLLVIEDAAQAVGASYKSKKSGSFGDAGCFSLHPLKNLHVHGDGGVITTNNEDFFNKVLKMRNHGLKNRDECEFWGWNSRLDEIQASIANLKLSYINKWNDKFLEIATFYIKELSSYIEVPSIEEFEKPVFHRFIIQHNNRDDLKSFLEKKGVITAINYPIPLHLHKASSQYGYKMGDFPIAEKQANRILSLPIYAELEDSQAHYVVQCVKEFLKV
jgi:dTDP-4-amino-4,6-dideoxygalactose transaminase